MQPRIETLTERMLVGMRTTMSFAENKTHELWVNFMPRLKEISNRVSSELYSVEVFEPDFFAPFDFGKTFEKWAAVEVSKTEILPDNMEVLPLPTGDYAVFLHKGPASDGHLTYRYIFDTWLPASEYVLDDRPHFARMGDKYKHEAPDSEEEIWIPIRQKP